MKILIVEDSSLELQRIRRMVSETVPEATIHAYTDSLAAKDAIAQGLRPDVAFLDIEMPSPTGMELAELLKTVHENVNIIFTTAYSSYMQQAFGLFASGYLLKPFSRQDIETQLSHLRHPPVEELPAFFARTRGQFDFYCHGKPVNFSLVRAKEAMAYLIDRRGASVTKRELFGILFEDELYDIRKQDHMKKIMLALKTSLENVGAERVLLHNRNAYAIDMNVITTDLPGAEEAKNGPYMEQYSWADDWRN